MRISRLASSVFVAAALVLTLARCAEPPSAPSTPSAAAPAPLAPSFSVASYSAQSGALLACPVRAAKTFTVVIDQRGARYAKHGIEVVVPPGALSGPTAFRIHIPRSQYVEADIDAIGQDHFTFAKPVTVSFDYSRCGNVTRTAPELSAWYIADDTRQLLEAMPGLDDRTSRTITFQITHLSGYGLAYRTGREPEPSDSTAN